MPGNRPTQADLDRGHQDGVRACVTWLHRRAEAMNDPHAKAVLNVAAHDLGVEKPSDDRELGEFADTLALCTNARNARGDMLLGEQGLRRLVQLLRGEAVGEAP